VYFWHESLLAKADGCTLGVSPKKIILFNTYCQGVDVNIEYICMTTQDQPIKVARFDTLILD
jgi:hypothetical protein